ncbi:TPA: sugar transferase, partial [Streptococcus suis]
NSYKLLPEEDPRLTTIGAFIRKTSIDEFPQFVNLLLGEMSFIGPRPILENELQEYTPEQQKKFLSVKPGITGWWQVSGRSEVFYPERC